MADRRKGSAVGTDEAPPQRSQAAEPVSSQMEPAQPSGQNARVTNGPDTKRAAPTVDGRAHAGRKAIQVPQRPALAPGVRLAGEMHESAFKDPPWLIERKGAGYVQVTELLYRIAEQCDGQHTLEQIAEHVSRVSGRGVSADNVKQLVGTQLLLKGLVQTADGKVLQSPSGARSLLAINMRQRMIGADQLEPFARALQVLFWPPVLITVVIVALMAQAWLYFIHGVAQGAHDVLYAPGLLLVAIAVTAVSAGFHELGHAAALRYGGGNAKGMGFGIYLIYPAFYTDVSDNYRLGRWARIRTDLGGVYFNLVFILGVMGLFLLTGQEFLLIIVVLLNLEIFRQLMPLVRLDGYWVVADATGVPDFLSRVGPFLKRILPIKSEEGEKLPPLKWWGTLVFGAYVFIAIPLLIFLIGTMLMSVPRILATAWDSAKNQLSAFSQAQAAGDGLGMAAAIAQLLLLSLPTLGILYSLYRFGSRTSKAVWTWSQESPGRKAVAAVGTLGVAVALYHFWGPGLPFDRARGTEDRHGRWVPIERGDRGTVFDVVSAAPPPLIQSFQQPPSNRDDGQVPAPAASPAAAPSPNSLVPGAPSPEPTATQTAEPTATQTAEPSATATVVPTAPPTRVPVIATSAPTSRPASTAVPTAEPATPAVTEATPVIPPTQAAATSTPSRQLGAPSTLPPVAPNAAAPTSTRAIPTPARTTP